MSKLYGVLFCVLEVVRLAIAELVAKSSFVFFGFRRKSETA